MKTNPVPSHRESYTPTFHSSDRSRLRSILGGLAVIVAVTGLPAKAQCPVVELASGFSRPVAIAQSSQGNLLISDNRALGARSKTGRFHRHAPILVPDSHTSNKGKRNLKDSRYFPQENIL